MSTPWNPGDVPTDPAELPGFLRRELLALKEGLENAGSFLHLVVLYAAPKRTRAGMVVYADGSTWNPGSGEGIYRRDKANASWIFIG